MIAVKNEAFYSELIYLLQEAETEERVHELEKIANEEFWQRCDELWLDRFHWEMRIKLAQL
jgi:secreted Zn-dependent insulinase-like peptidase